MKRVKADSWAAVLSPDDRDELMSLYHDSKLSATDAAEQASILSGRSVTPGMFSNWYHGQRAAWLLQRASMAAAEATQASPGDLDELTTEAIRQARFAAVMADIDPAELAALERNEIARRKLALDERKIELDERRLVLLERKAAQADAAAQVATDESLSDTECAERVRAIFGMR